MFPPTVTFTPEDPGPFLGGLRSCSLGGTLIYNYGLVNVRERENPGVQTEKESFQQPWPQASLATGRCPTQADSEGKGREVRKGGCNPFLFFSSYYTLLLSRGWWSVLGK